MKKYIDKKELETRIALSCQRLSTGDHYQIDQVFSDPGYEWYGDLEGRALLAFVSHYKINGTEIACMPRMLAEMPDRLNEKGFFGPLYEGKIQEQQLSGHSWLLRGLCEHYEQFKDEQSLNMIKDIVENLYLPKAGAFADYPIDRDGEESGGVSGEISGSIANWIISQDTGCTFMSVDGLSHAYKVTKDARIKTLLDEMIAVYLKIDKVKLKAQTHCTLTSARGMMRMYQETKEEFYLEAAKSIMDLYVNGGGISLTYQNLNWWGRPKTWTEPCAIVDSLMLALELYKVTGEEAYRTLAARIYHNGLSTSQRHNGGAGVDTVVLEGIQDTLTADIMDGATYEAWFCCTMRLAEGLWYIYENADLLYAETEGQVTKKGSVYSDGDIIYVEVSENLVPYAEHFVEMDGHKLCPIVKYYKASEEACKKGYQKVVFGNTN